MPLHARKPNLPTLTLPTLSSGSSSSALRTPIPFTPVPFSQGPMAMTPDTPSFPSSDTDNAEDKPWTEDEDGLLQSYLSAPPRPLQTTYPPSTLPPPAALDEITTQLLSLDSHHLPARSWSAVRSRLFHLARQEAIGMHGGHNRQRSETKIILAPVQPPVSLRDVRVGSSQRPGLVVLGEGRGKGGERMNRQMHSMDSLYGDREAGDEGTGFREALRLSSDLQSNARDGLSFELHSSSGLSSPLAFNFSFTPSSPLGTARKPSLSSYPFPTSGAPRPTSLLQRGRSYTSDDWAREHKTLPPVDEFALDDADESTAADVDVDQHHGDTPTQAMRRSASSPVSSLTHSSPSTMSESEEDGGAVFGGGGLDVELLLDEEDPITPLNQTFPSALGLKAPPPVSAPMSETSSTTTTPSGRHTPAITLTVDSPERSSSSSASSSLSLSPARAFASLSISRQQPLLAAFGNTSPLPTAAHSHTTTTTNKHTLRGLSTTSTSSLRRARPPPLARSLSDSSHLHHFSSSSANLSGPLMATSRTLPSFTSYSDREPKRQRAMPPMPDVGPRFRPAGLSVLVPTREQGGEAGLLEELRSPFEHKPAAGQQMVAARSL